MSEKQSSSPPMAFILDFLKEKGDTPYRDVRAAAEEAGFTIYPIMYGRAKALLGMISEDDKAKRRKKREDAAAAATPAAERRPLRQSGGAPANDSTANQLSDFLERYQSLEEERNRYRAALLQLEDLLKGALGDRGEAIVEAARRPRAPRKPTAPTGDAPEGSGSDGSAGGNAPKPATSPEGSTGSPAASRGPSASSAVPGASAPEITGPVVRESAPSLPSLDSGSDDSSEEA